MTNYNPCFKPNIACVGDDDDPMSFLKHGSKIHEGLESEFCQRFGQEEQIFYEICRFCE